MEPDTVDHSEFGDQWFCKPESLGEGEGGVDRRVSEKRVCDWDHDIVVRPGNETDH